MHPSADVLSGGLIVAMLAIDKRSCTSPFYQQPTYPLPKKASGRFMGHGMIALTAPTISMKIHRHAKYTQHVNLLPSQTRRLSQSCTAWHAAPAPRQRHNACSAARHSNPRTCFHTHADITCTYTVTSTRLHSISDTLTGDPFAQTRARRAHGSDMRV